MKLVDWHRARSAIVAGLAALLAAASGCKSGAGHVSHSNAVDSRGETRLDANKFDPITASLCLQQMFKTSPGSFHALFLENNSKRDESRVEADVTPSIIDYRKRDVTAGQTSTSTKRLARTQMSEMELDFDVMGPVPWHGELVAAQDATRPTDRERMNGYNTTKFAIDTANEPAEQKTTFDSLMMVRDYKIVGNVWLTSDTGCLVKYTVDFEQDQKDGTINKQHFEGNITKK